jgi:hypothetical protein
VSGCWLLRSQSTEELLKCNDDAGVFTWTKVEIGKDGQPSAADKKKIQEFWCSDDYLEGRPIADYKCFK